MMNPKEMIKAMQRLGIQPKQINAESVIILTENKKIIIQNPEVLRINFMGQDTWQIMGKVTEQPRVSDEKTVEQNENIEFSEEDIKLVMEQSKVSYEEAKEALEKTKDLAEAILYLQEKKINKQ